MWPSQPPAHTQTKWLPWHLKHKVINQTCKQFADSVCYSVRNPQNKTLITIINILLCLQQKHDGNMSSTKLCLTHAGLKTYSDVCIITSVNVTCDNQAQWDVTSEMIFKIKSTYDPYTGEHDSSEPREWLTYLNMFLEAWRSQVSEIKRLQHVGFSVRLHWDTALLWAEHKRHISDTNVLIFSRSHHHWCHLTS